MSAWLFEDKSDDNVEGMFECETCFEYVRTARYEAQAKTLSWRCSKGHKTTLKDVTL